MQTHNLKFGYNNRTQTDRLFEAICFYVLLFEYNYSTIKIKQKAHCGLVSEKFKIRNQYNGDMGETWDFKLTMAY